MALLVVGWPGLRGPQGPPGKNGKDGAPGVIGIPEQDLIIVNNFGDTVMWVDAKTGKMSAAVVGEAISSLAFGACKAP